MGRKRRQEEHVNHERWLISYADFITLLFAFFVVMYSISSVNEGKYRVLSDTLVEAFTKQPQTMEPVPMGTEGRSGPASIIDTDSSSAGQSSELSIIEQLQRTAENNELDEMADEVEVAMAPLIDRELIDVQRDDLWVEIEFNTSILFDSGSAELEDDAIPVLSDVAQILQKYPNYIQVEGFTDNLPINTLQFASNWELSAGRAASVVHLFMKQGVKPDRMAAIGYGEFRPKASNDTPEGRNANRRVVLVVLADAHARRALDIQRNRIADRPS